MRRLLSVTAAVAVLAAAPLAGQTPTPVEADPALEDLQPGSQAELNGLRIVTMAGTFGGGVFDVQVVYDAEQRVVGFSVRPPGAGGR